MRIFALFVALALAGRTAVAQPEHMTALEVSKWLAFFDKLVDAVVKDQDACDKMANDVAAVIDANQDSIAIARAARVAHKRLPESAQQHMLDGVKKMGPGIEKCADNEKVKAAFAKLEVKEPTEKASDKTTDKTTEKKTEKTTEKTAQ
jgi:hypothetical protein